MRSFAKLTDCFYKRLEFSTCKTTQCLSAIFSDFSHRKDQQIVIAEFEAYREDAEGQVCFAITNTKMRHNWHNMDEVNEHDDHNERDGDSESVRYLVLSGNNLVTGPCRHVLLGLKHQIQWVSIPKSAKNFLNRGVATIFFHVLHLASHRY